MARVQTAYVSKFQRARIHHSAYIRGEFTVFSANFNGTVDPDVLIESVTWYTTTPWALILSNAQIADDQRSVSVDCLIGWAGPGDLKCVVTLSDGQIRNQLYTVRIGDGPYFTGESTPSQGPTSVSAEVAPEEPLGVTIDPPGAEGSFITDTGLKGLGSYLAQVTGGSPPYTYAWSFSESSSVPPYGIGGDDTEEANVSLQTNGYSGLYSADLTVLVTDSLGAEASDTVFFDFTITGI